MPKGVEVDTPTVGKNASEDDEEIFVEKVELKRSINFLSVTSILITNVGGASIFISPAAILMYAGSPIVALIIWTVSGILNAGLAFCFLEIGLLFPKAGGPYFYILEAFGSLPAFMFLWGFILLIAASAWAIGGYSAAAYILSAFRPDCRYPESAVKLLGAWLIVTLVALNCTYMKFVTKVQTVLSFGKILALLMIIVVGLFHFFTSENEAEIERIKEIKPVQIGNLALGMFAGFFNYGGWQVVTIMMEEVKNPQKILPRSVLLSFSTMIIMYVLVNLSYFLLLSPSQMFKSDAVAVLAMQNFHPVLGAIISILVAASALSVLNVIIMGQPRLLFAAARVGHVPELFHMISREYLTPWPAIIFFCLPAFTVLMMGNIIMFIDAISLFACIMTSTVLIALLYIRLTRPDTKYTLKVPIFLPILMLAINLVLLCMSVYEKPQELGTCLILLSFSLPVYFFGVVWKNKPKWFNLFMARLTMSIKAVLALETSKT